MSDQYHEPPEELSAKTRDIARVMKSMIEEAEAISWYLQRIAATKNKEAAGVIRHAMEEEFEHFAIELEWVSRKLPKFREVLKAILFKKGDILKNAEKWEEENE